MAHRFVRILSCAFALIACDVGDPCDADMRYVNGVCIAVPAAGGRGGDDGGHDAAAPDDEDAATADTGGACADPLASLGETCTTSSECSCEADLCAVMPGATSGYCSVSPCTVDGGECPDGWSCFDLSSLGVMGVPPFCLRP